PVPTVPPVAPPLPSPPRPPGAAAPPIGEPPPPSAPPTPTAPPAPAGEEPPELPALAPPAPVPLLPPVPLACPLPPVPGAPPTAGRPSGRVLDRRPPAGRHRELQLLAADRDDVAVVGGAAVEHDRDEAAVRVLERDRVSARRIDALRTGIDELREVPEDVVG